MYGRFMRALARRAGIRVFRLYRRKADFPAAEPSLPQGLELRPMTEREVLALCSQPSLDLDGEKASDAYARGDLCLAAFERGEAVGYCWLAFAPLPHLDGVWVDFDNRAAWVYKSLVLAPHRGRGIAPTLYRFAERWCTRNGREYALICMESHNRASIAAARRAGYRASGMCGYMLRRHHVRCWVSPRARRASVRFYLPATVQ